jgi:F0F1-type ATP synthase membrane subunit c/vacuolar-type H+-ATPase subunit K
VVTALGGLDRLPWPELTTGAVYVAAFVFAHEGGNTIVRGVLPERAPDSEADELAVGYLIGTLERWIILLLGVAGLWEAIAIVVAVESIARFEELKQRAFAEYFLVGTLTSVLVAIVLVLLVTALV